jgi:outer membrane protein OmpA-like peptidoglycan-associated protein
MWQEMEYLAGVQRLNNEKEEGSKMRSACRFILVAAVSALLAQVAHASMMLNVIEVPAKGVTVDFKPAAGAPGFSLKAGLSFKNGQSVVDISFSGKHRPAVLYGGDVTCYVLWAMAPDRSIVNLGELRVTGDNLTSKFRTPIKKFALLVTAESYSLVERPSDFAVFFNNPPEKKDVVWKAVSFDNFARAAAHTRTSIGELEFEETTPIDLLQARKAFELAGREQAATYAPILGDLAGKQLRVAEDLNKKGDWSKKFHDAARSSIDSSAQAIKIATSTKAAKLLAEVIAERQAKMASLKERSEADEMVIAMLQARKADLETQVGILSQELKDTLARIAMARITAAGVVLTLPDISFDTDQATLKRDAEISLAKLSGLMLIFSKVKADVGGYTDSSGTPEHNMDLSLRRAQAVSKFLADQDVDPERLSAVGNGPADPVADNSTPDGRSKNRRVELTIIPAN